MDEIEEIEDIKRQLSTIKIMLMNLEKRIEKLEKQFLDRRKKERVISAPPEKVLKQAPKSISVPPISKTAVVTRALSG